MTVRSTDCSTPTYTIVLILCACIPTHVIKWYCTFVMSVKPCGSFVQCFYIVASVCFVNFIKRRCFCLGYFLWSRTSICCWMKNIRLNMVHNGKNIARSSSKKKNVSGEVCPLTQGLILEATEVLMIPCLERIRIYVL